MISLVTLLLALAVQAAPVQLTPAQQAAISAGETWLEHQRAGEDRLSGILRAVVAIDAPEDRVWGAVLDFETMAARSGAVRDVSRYRDRVRGDVREVGLDYHLRVFVRDVRYAIAHEYDAGARSMTWELDPAREHDLRQLEGSFRTAPGPEPGTTLLLYESRVDTGQLIPEWVERHLREKALKQFLEGIRQGAESPGGAGRGAVSG